MHRQRRLAGDAFDPDGHRGNLAGSRLNFGFPTLGLSSKLVMCRCWALDFDAYCERSTIARFGEFSELVGHAIDHLVSVFRFIGVHFAAFPAKHIRRSKIDGHVVIVTDSNEKASFGPCLTDVAALDVAGKDDVGVVAKDTSRLWMWPKAQ